MPYYEYHCPANGRTVEVRHGMSERLASWSEVAERSATPLGNTPPDSPVERLMSAPAPVSGAADAREAGGCGHGCACA